MRLPKRLTVAESLENRLLLAYVPVILKVSDAVAPGSEFTVNGGGINASTVDVAIAPESTPTLASAIYPQILQTDVNSNFVVCRMPIGLAPGVYEVWVENAAGWSAPVLMNAARALYQSDYQGYTGINIEVVGRNFEQTEFGGVNATEVRLNNGAGGIYPQTIATLNPYDVSFNISATAPTGTYYIEISNDNGLDWSRPSSGQTLAIIAHTGTDPLGLGVSWAQNFNWTSIFNVTTYGATGNDTTDDTTAVKNAIAAANANGGGVVYFPNGSYYISGLSIPSNVVLEGQSESGANIVYDGGGGSSFIRSTIVSGSVVQLQGIAQLSITLSNPTTISLRPDEIINLGNSTANRIFVDSVNISYPYTTGDSAGADGRRGIALMFGASQDVLIANNHFAGWEGTMPDDTVNQYCEVKNNYFEYSCGYVHDSATYAFFENNVIVIHPEYDQNSHGIFGRSDAYMANNSITGAGDASNVQNDGEAIATEGPSGTFNFGTVTSATSTSLTVSPQQPLATPTLAYGILSVIITNGTGLGQIDTVTGISGNTITLAQPLAIVPDATSSFSLLTPLTGMTVYNNAISNCAKGIWVYGLAYDDVVANNTLTNTEGIYVHAVVNDQNTTATAAVSYFVRIINNTVAGVSPRDGYSGIGLNTGRFGTVTFEGVQSYGTQILYNSITGDGFSTGTGAKTESGPFSGIYAISDGQSTASNGTGTGDETNLIVEGNHLYDLKYGVTISNSDYGQVISQELYGSSVATFLQNSLTSSYGLSQNTLVTADNGTPTVTISGTAAGDTFNLKADPTWVHFLDVNGATYSLFGIDSVIVTGSTGNEVVTFDFVNGPLTDTFGVLAPFGVTFNAGSAGNVLNTVDTGGGVAGTMPVFFVPGSSVANNINAAAGVITVPDGTQAGIRVAAFSTLQISAGAEVAIASPLSNQSNRTLVVITESLSLSGTTNAWKGTLDLGSNDLDENKGNLAQLNNQIGQGWNESESAIGGIISSAAAVNNTHLTALGVILNSATGNVSGGALYTTFDTAGVTNTDVLVKYTYLGDTNLDGKVDGTDYSRIDIGYLDRLSGWFNGDFNYDGSVNGSDYTLMDNAFNSQGAKMAASIASPVVVAASEIVVRPPDLESSIPSLTTSGLDADENRHHHKRAYGTDILKSDSLQPGSINTPTSISE